jgi:hypothetical protein
MILILLKQTFDLRETMIERHFDKINRLSLR